MDQHYDYCEKHDAQWHTITNGDQCPFCEREQQAMDQSRMLDDVRNILMQEINVYRVGRDWGFSNAGIVSDGYWTKDIAEIAARDAIIEAARAVAHVV